MSLERTCTACGAASDGYSAAPYCCTRPDYDVRWVCDGCNAHHRPGDPVMDWTVWAAKRRHACPDCSPDAAEVKQRRASRAKAKPKDAGEGLFS